MQIHVEPDATLNKEALQVEHELTVSPVQD
jgi:hypothetical protein